MPSPPRNNPERVHAWPQGQNRKPFAGVLGKTRENQTTRVPQLARQCPAFLGELRVSATLRLCERLPFFGECVSRGQCVSDHPDSIPGPYPPLPDPLPRGRGEGTDISRRVAGCQPSVVPCWSDFSIRNPHSAISRPQFIVRPLTPWPAAFHNRRRRLWSIPRGSCPGEDAALGSRRLVWCLDHASLTG